MYTFQSMLSVPIGYKPWDTANLTALTLGGFFNLYTEGYLTLKDNVNDTVYVKVSDLPYGDGTIASIIATATAIPAISRIPVKKEVKYSDAIQARYKIKLTSIANPATNIKSELHDARLYIDPEYTVIHRRIHERCLVTVNGYIHQTYMNDGTDMLYIERAGDTLMRGTNNHVGIMDFSAIGTLTKVTPTVSHTAADAPYKEGVVISIPLTASVVGKTAFLVLGGYLVFLDGEALSQISERDYLLDIRKLPFIERINESSEYMQMDELGLSTPFDLGSSFSVEEMLSDAVLTNYITKLTQSFMVLAPAVSLVTEPLYIRKVGSIGTFITYQEPVYPLVIGYGKLADYWKVKEGDKWAVKVADYVYGNYLLNEAPISAIRHHPFSPYMQTKAHLLKITGYQS